MVSTAASCPPIEIIRAKTAFSTKVTQSHSWKPTGPRERRLIA
jgi:hypothetical protein